ncbi:hypothetical protein IBX35_02650 [Candidatus Bathyarchaeota archaeon]|nr:hypothetical protein [Candidatus Bathyarchaeota archaeon]
MKRKLAMVCVALLLLPLAFGMVQPVKASSNTWSVNWHDYIIYDSPINVSTTTEVVGANGHCTTIVELVVSIGRYHWDDFLPLDFVYFRVVVYVKAIADPGYQPQYATDVSIQLKKIGSNQDHTKIRLVHEEPEHSQGHYLTQTTAAASDPLERIELALVPLEYAVGLACEPAGMAIMLINMASAFGSISGVDFQDAEYDDTFAYSWWHNDAYLGSESPVRQYCFNCFRWKQDHDVWPEPDYGLKIWAGVDLYNPAVIPPFWTNPIYLYIYGGGGGACPYVSTWNGTQYVLDNNILPAAEYSGGVDVTDYYKLQKPFVVDKGKYSLIISEFENEHSYLDQVRLLAVDHPPDVNVAVTPYGEILTYSNPVPPVSAVDDDGIDVLSLLSSVDGNYYQGYNGSYVTLTFASTDVSNGVKLIVREDYPLRHPWLKSPVYVQALNATGEWDTAAVFHTRTYWATDIINMTDYLPDAEGNLKVRLCFVSNDKIDYVGLDTSKQGEFEVRYANMASAIHSKCGDVKEMLMHSDNIYTELLPGEQITLKFTLPQNTKDTRDFIIIAEGHYFTI